MDEAVHYKVAFFHVSHLKQVDSLRYKADSISQQRIIFSFKNKKDQIKTYPKPKTEIEYIKEPVDSMLVYHIIYKKMESEANRLHGKSGYKAIK